MEHSKCTYSILEEENLMHKDFFQSLNALPVSHPTIFCVNFDHSHPLNFAHVLSNIASLSIKLFMVYIYQRR